MSIDFTQDNHIWLAAEVMAERAASTALLVHVFQEKTLSDVTEFMESLLDNPYRLRDFFSEDLYLIEGATEADLDLLFDDYLPTLLNNQIEFVKSLPDPPQRDNHDLSTGIVATKKRKIGFMHLAEKPSSRSNITCTH